MAENTDYSCADKWGFSIIGGSILLMLVMFGCWFGCSSHSPESRHITFQFELMSDSESSVPTYAKVQVDSIVDELRSHERLLDEKHQYLLDQKESEDRFKTVLMLIFSVVVATAGFFGYKNMADIRKHSIEEAIRKAESVANDKAEAVANVKAEETANIKAAAVADAKASEVANRVATDTATTVATNIATSTATSTATDTSNRVAQAKATEIAESVASRVADEKVTQEVSSYLDLHLESKLQETVSSFYSGQGLETIRNIIEEEVNLRVEQMLSNPATPDEGSDEGEENTESDGQDPDDLPIPGL